MADKQVLLMRCLRRTIEKLEGIFKPERTNILETQKVMEKVQTLPLMHYWTMLNNHSIDFNDAHGIDKGNFRVRKTLEYWQTAITSESVTRTYYPGIINCVMNSTLAFYFRASNLLFLLLFFSTSHVFTVHISAFALFTHICQRLQSDNRKL